MNSIVFTHGDSDGICSGAIAKSAFPGSTVFFTNPVNLLSDLTGISEHYNNIVICDIAIDEKTSIQIKQKLSELAQISDVSYIDHHPVPEGGFNKSWFHHDTCSSAELTYRIFEKRLNRDIRRVAIYGAIGEFSETAAIKKWERLWDVIDINGYMSKAAIYAGSFGRTLVGVSCEYRPHKQVYDISLRLKNGGVDLNTILRRLAPYHGGTGGGHPFAGGARIPRDELKAFLYDLDDALGR
ncbi:MAG: DHHA1 domain-containing protein [Candidatus Methanoperedens sp.]|nr:DHHA1 domain-containing protein [Candidatus Methanoperedens sp.]